MSITLSQLASRYSKAAKSLDQNTDKALRTLAVAATGHMKRSIQKYHAVDTGTMLNSTTAENPSSGVYLIGPTVDYAVYVALGTSRMRARPFHTDAAQEVIKDARSLGFSAEDVGI